MIKYVVTDFDEEELKISPKLFSKALLASIYMNRSNKKMSLRSAYKRALLRDVWSLKNIDRKEISALLYFVDYLLKLPKDMSEQLQQEIRAEIRKEDEMMLELYKADLPPNISRDFRNGTKRRYGVGDGKRYRKGIRRVIVGLIENGFSDDMIARVANQTIEQVQAIRSEMELK